MARVAINGLGRIGRAALKVVRETPELELVTVNDIAPADNIAYLIKYDSVYGRYPEDVRAEGDQLIIGDDSYPYLSEKDPADLPWDEMGIDLVFECTGLFRETQGAAKHIEAGAQYVIISAPTKSEDTPTIVYGVNQPDEATRILSCASCTTNNIAPVVEVVGRRIGIKKAIMTTVHGYTASQSLVDAPSKKERRGRAAALNIVPTSTGAAIATTKTLPQYQDLFHGIAMRVPVPVGSIADIVFVTERDTTVEEINQILREEASTERYQGVLGATDEPLVSTDIIGDPRASVVDLSMTQVVDGDLVKVLTWYDNEWGYTNQMVRQALKIFSSREEAETVRT
ncbi:MAG: type I glyceraldehyde-3-phosphate dehydrogenase [Chloroflexota bacterium]|nr:type I glyceraldehyde-3-phosphate dehydrogenase [Chloroflexota bacterium]